MTSSRSCGSVIPETAARKAAAAVEPFAVDTGVGAGQLDGVVEADDISAPRGANRPPTYVNFVAVTLNLATSTKGFRI